MFALPVERVDVGERVRELWGISAAEKEAGGLLIGDEGFFPPATRR